MKKNKMYIFLIIVAIVSSTFLITITLPLDKREPSEKTTLTNTTKEIEKENSNKELPKIVENKKEKAYLTYDIEGDYFIDDFLDLQMTVMNLINGIDPENGPINKSSVYYSNMNNEKDGHVGFVYWIEGKIETNRVYMAFINNNKLDKIVLAGIKKSNINKISKVDEEKLITKADTFENSKKPQELKKQIDDQIDDSTKISEKEEKYYYDYNTGKLYYQYTVFITGNTTSSKSIEYEVK